MTWANRTTTLLMQETSWERGGSWSSICSYPGSVCPGDLVLLVSSICFLKELSCCGFDKLRAWWWTNFYFGLCSRIVLTVDDMTIVPFCDAFCVYIMQLKVVRRFLQKTMSARFGLWPVRYARAWCSWIVPRSAPPGETGSFTLQCGDGTVLVVDCPQGETCCPPRQFFGTFTWASSRTHTETSLILPGEDHSHAATRQEGSDTKKYGR